MSFKQFAASAVLAILATPAWAADIEIHDAYARAAGTNAKAGAAFMEIRNTGTADDRLVSATSDAAVRVELHTHKENADGVMQMLEVEEGFAIPAGGSHMLKRGGDHVMFMGLTGPMEHGKMVTVTLVFEQAGELDVDIPVDLERKPEDGAMKHGH